VRLKTEIVAARVLAAAGNPGEATRNLRAAISEAQKSGFFVRQLDASLALAEIQAKSGHQRDALVLLQSVEKEARSPRIPSHRSQSHCCSQLADAATPKTQPKVAAVRKTAAPSHPASNLLTIVLTFYNVADSEH